MPLLLPLIILLAATAQPVQPAPDLGENLTGILDRWEEQYVEPIITAEEREFYRRLRDDQERLAFVETFWRRRDPTPKTPENEYRDAYRARFLEAVRRYGAGRPGWRTDRGRAYLLLGPPASVWNYLSGEAGQGFPAEVWTYNGLPSARLEASVDLTFVDFEGTGDYRLVSDRDLMFTSRSGFNGRGLDQYSTIGPDGMNLQGLGMYGAGLETSDRLEALQNLAEIQQLAVPDVPESASLVTTRMSLSRLEVGATTGSYRGSTGRTLLGVTFAVDPAGLEPEPSPEGGRHFLLDCYGTLVTPEGSMAAEFQRRLRVSRPEVEPMGGGLSYSFGLEALPGDYRLKLALVDPRSHRAGGLERSVTLPAFPQSDPGRPPAHPGLSSVVLVAAEDRSPGSPEAGDPYRLSRELRLVPAVDHHVPAGAVLDLHFQVYDVPLEGEDLTLALLTPAGRPALVQPQERLSPGTGGSLTVRTGLPTEGLLPGPYRLRVDLGSGDRRVSRELELMLIEPVDS